MFSHCRFIRNRSHTKIWMWKSCYFSHLFLYKLLLIAVVFLINFECGKWYGCRSQTVVGMIWYKSLMQIRRKDVIEYDCTSSACRNLVRKCDLCAEVHFLRNTQTCNYWFCYVWPLECARGFEHVRLVKYTYVSYQS